MPRHLVALQEFLKCIGSRDSQMAMPKRIEYHTGDSNKDTNAFEKEMEKSIRPYLPAATTLTVVRWKDQRLRPLVLERRWKTGGCVRKRLGSQNNNCLKVRDWSTDNACETVFGYCNAPSFI